MYPPRYYIHLQYFDNSQYTLALEELKCIYFVIIFSGIYSNYSKFSKFVNIFSIMLKLRFHSSLDIF
jgi:hypothetical protein